MASRKIVITYSPENCHVKTPDEVPLEEVLDILSSAIEAVADMLSSQPSKNELLDESKKVFPELFGVNKDKLKN